MRLSKRTAPLLLGLVLLIGAVIAAVASAPSHNRPSHLAGLVIADSAANDLTRLPRSALTCISNRKRDSCQITIAGATLHIDVVYPSSFNWQFQECTATYAGQTAPCWATHSTVGGPLYAVMSSSTLGVPSAALSALRRQYITDNLSEAEWEIVTRVAALLAAISAGAGACWATRGRWRRAGAVLAGSSGAFLFCWILVTWILLITARID